MIQIRHNGPTVFFAWEKRRGIRALVARAPTRKGLLVVAVVGALLLLRQREHRAAEVRATRAELGTAANAVTAWRADHERACPGSLAELVSSGYLSHTPRDSWGHALRMTCPGRRDPRGFDLSSDGPDGVPGGTDRVE